MKKSLLVVLSILILTTIAACGGKDELLPPEAVQAGVDRCEHCNMLVPDDHNATQVVLNDGRSLKFDDIGCLVEWTNDNGLEEVNVRYVRDFHNGEWVQIEQATFVYHPEFRTPMAYGLYSFSSKDEAEAFISEHGKGELLLFEDLEGHSWERHMESMDGHGHGHGHSEGSNDHGEKDSHGHNEDTENHDDEANHGHNMDEAEKEDQ